MMIRSSGRGSDLIRFGPTLPSVRKEPTPSGFTGDVILDDEEAVSSAGFASCAIEGDALQELRRRNGRHVAPQRSARPFTVTETWGRFGHASPTPTKD